MKTKSLIFAVTFVLYLALLSCAYASDANETAIVDDSSFVESNVDYEDDVVDVSLCSKGNGIDYYDNPVDDIVINNKNNYTYNASFSVVDNCEHDAEFGFGIENYETLSKVYVFFNNSQFCNINFESDGELILDATVDNQIFTVSLIKLNQSLDNVSYFESFQIKMEDLDSSLFEEGKFQISFTIVHELTISLWHENNFENCLDCNIIICSNKLADNFAYSINNSIIDQESNIVYYSLNSSYFVHLFINTKFSIFLK